MIPYSRQSISITDIFYVIKSLKSNYLSQGPMVTLFEENLTKFCNVKFGVSTSSATGALHIACLALGVGKGDYVWTSATSFVASANSAIYCGAKVDFIDIDPLTMNISIDFLRNKLNDASTKGKLPKVVIPVHFAGQSCEMSQLQELSSEFGFKILEDASHALGGSYSGNIVGSCKYSDITVFSFHPVKSITTGEGGFATTNSPDLIEKMRLLRSHGIERNSSNFDLRASDEIWNYQQKVLGYNYRMSDINASLGVSQISKIDRFISKRNKIAQGYHKSLIKLGLIPQKILENIFSSYHLYTVRVEMSNFGKSQSQVYKMLREFGIEANLHYIPIHLQPYYEKMGFKRGDFPESEKFFREVISLPIYPRLKKSQQNYIVEKLQKIKEY